MTGLHNTTAMIVKVVAVALLWALALGASAQTVRYIHTDSLGSVAVVTDQSRNVIERREYEPYGRQLTPAVKDGPGYTGHVQDAVTGLTYMQQRYYDPQVGMFLSVDPVTAYSNGDMRFFNRYAYAFNNPSRFTDPDGRQSALRCQSACDALNKVLGAMRGAEKIDRDLVQPVTSALDKVDVRLEGQVAAGLGIEASISLKDGSGDVSFVMAGEGAAVSLTVQPKEGFTFELPSKGSEAPMSLTSEAAVGYIGYGGVEVEANPGGTLKATPKVGLGIGEYLKTTPSIQFFQWGKKEK